ncbi:hypothetical protein FACS1894151_00940 [Spirochaetia bacterium]|nr:hypothetical protein FACS1894151_00940 [Spirochaetia bacterium]
MKVIIDTPIWSLAFRKKVYIDKEIIINNLTNIIRNEQIGIIGSIRQEVLSGISDKNKFYEIKKNVSIYRL